MTNEIKDYFDKAAINRNLKFSSDPIGAYEQRVRAKKVFSMLEARPDERILEVGCGNGRDIIPLAKKGCKCIGVDFSETMIEEARKEAAKNAVKGIELETGDATNLRFPDEMFDKVFASEVLEHIPDYHKSISEMARVLRPGGTLVITTPNRLSIYGIDRYIIYPKILRRKIHHPYDAWKTFSELKSALVDNGFKIVSFSGGCYIPGTLVCGHLPKIIKKLIVVMVGSIETLLSKIFPKNGYTIAIKAVKK